MDEQTTRSNSGSEPARPVKPDGMASLGGLAAFWERSGPGAAAVFWVLLVSACALRAYMGLSGTRIFSHDAFVVLDGAWRMMNGQRPHVDFSSMMGPVAYLPTCLGLWLSGGQSSGFGYGQAIAGMLLGLWAYGMGRELSPLPRMAFALCAGAIAIYPAQLGMSAFEITPATTYNKYGYSLLGILLLERVQQRSGAELRGGISTGAIVAVLAFLKISYFAVAILMLVALYRVRTRTARQWVGMLVGAGAAGGCFLWYVRFRVDLVLRDLQQTAAARQIAFFDVYRVNSIFLEAALGLVIGLGGAAWLRSMKSHDAAERVSLVTATTVFASVALIFCNWQPAELPLIGFSLIYLVDELIRCRATADETGTAFRGVIVASSTAFVGVTLAAAFASLLWGGLLKEFIAPRCLHFSSPVLSSFVPIGQEQSYTAFVNDGLRLLEDNRQPGEHVMSLDLSNPFSFALRIPPAAGGATTLQFASSFDDQHRWSAERLFGSAELVMLPRQYSDGSLNLSVPRNYGAYLSAHYRAAAESSDWVLYRRIL